MDGLRHEGWCSQKFPKYPQEVVLEFEGPMRVKSLQLLCHDFKIASKVELFYVPHFNYAKQQYGPRRDQLKSIGSFSFEDCDPEVLQTGHGVRELKTVHLSDIYTRYLKIDLFHPFENRRNVFNQVSLISVTAVGMQLEPVQQAVVHDAYEAAFMNENPPPEEASGIRTRRSSNNLGGAGKPFEPPGQLVNEEELQTFDAGTQLQVRDALQDY